MLRKCLICYCEILHSPFKVEDHPSPDDLSKHLQVIFILRNIFQVPVTQLSNYLKNCPQVDEWICICEKCTELASGYRAIYNDLMDISRKVEELKRGIIGIVKKSNDDKTSLETQIDPVFLKITNECRRFINYHEYQWPVNPFTNGDLKAVQLLNKSTPISNDYQDKPVTRSKNCRTQSKTKSNTLTTAVNPNDDPDHYSNDDDDFKPDTDEEEDLYSDENDEEEESILNTNHIIPTKIKSKDVPPPPPKERKLTKYQKYKKPGKYHECPHCPSKKYVNKASLVLHFKNKHPDIPPPPKSKACKPRKYPPECYTFSPKRKRPLNCDIRPFQCDHCEMAFKFSQNLKYHRKRYHGEDGGIVKLICEICGASFSHKRYLSDHVKMQHEGEYKLRCDQCGRGYAGEELLKVHLFLKHGIGRVEDMKWRCGVEGCGKVFWKKGPLDLHLRIKHEEGQGAEWTCEECGKQFYQKYNLTCHYKTIHEGAKFKCDICGVEVGSKGYLPIHKKRMHKIFPPKK